MAIDDDDDEDEDEDEDEDVDSARIGVAIARTAPDPLGDTLGASFEAMSISPARPQG